jgi:hypothetical protein
LRRRPARGTASLGRDRGSHEQAGERPHRGRAAISPTASKRSPSHMTGLFTRCGQ